MSSEIGAQEIKKEYLAELDRLLAQKRDLVTEQHHYLEFADRVSERA